MAQNLGKKK